MIRFRIGRNVSHSEDLTITIFNRFCIRFQWRSAADGISPHYAVHFWKSGSLRGKSFTIYGQD